MILNKILKEQLTNVNYDFFTHLLKFPGQLLQWLRRLALNVIFSHRCLKLCFPDGILSVFVRET
jgi:hypothetical protein